MSHQPHQPPDSELPPGAKRPKERWKGQFERYREDVALGEYEAMLGGSELDIDNLDEFLRVTAEKVPPPWEREGPCGKDAGAHQSGKWKDLSPDEIAAEMAKYSAAEQGEKRCAPDSSSPRPPRGRRAGRKKGRHDEEHCAPDSSSPLPPRGRGAGGEGGGEPDAAQDKKRRPRKPRCTKQAKKDRLEDVARWLEDGAGNRQIISTCKKAFGVGRRMSLLYIQEVKKNLADQAAAEDQLAHLQLSKNQHNALYQRALVNLDKIDDPTKVAGLLRAGNTILKDRDKVAEDIRHHRAVTRRDQSPDSRKNRLRREEIVEFTWDNLKERCENLRNGWWWQWNQARMAGGETHFNDILRQKVDPELGYFDPERAYNWEAYEKWKAEGEKGRTGERANTWPEYCDGAGGNNSSAGPCRS